MTAGHLQSYLKFLVKHPLSSVLKLMGLSVGIAVLITVGMYVNHEISYERYHNGYQNIYRVIQVSNFNGIVENSSSAPFPLKNHLEKEFHGRIEGCARIFNYQNTLQLVSSEQKTAFEEGLFFVDPEFFRLFSVRWLKGKDSEWLEDKFTAVITRSAASKFFPSENPVGKKLTINGRYEVTIEAVFDDPPSQTHFRYSILVSMETVRDNYRGKFPDTWAWNPCWTYVKFKENTTRGEAENRLSEMSRNMFPVKRDYSSLFLLQPIAEIHLFSRLDYEISPNGSWSNVLTLGALGLFIFLLSIINYIGLSTAKSFERSKEIAVRKINGATGVQIVLQTLSEVAFITFLAIIIALSMVEMFLPYFRSLVSVPLSFRAVFSWPNLILLGAILLFSTLAGGIYPSLLLRKINIVEVIKGKLPAEPLQSRIRKTLVLVQVALAIGLLVVNQVVERQYRFLLTHNLGFRSRDIIVIPTRLPEVQEKYNLLLSGVRAIPQVTHITGMDYKIGINHNFYPYNVEQEGKDNWQYFPALMVQDNFVETFDIQLIAGRSYNAAIEQEGKRSILVSEAMCNHLGILPRDAIGKSFKSWRGEEQIIGVFKNFSAKSLHFRQGPFVLDMRTTENEKIRSGHYTAIRVKPGTIYETIPQLERTWKTLFPEKPFQYSILEDEIQNHYRMEKMLLTIASILTVIALLMAFVGIWGFGVYYSSRRKKEFAVRLIMGADFGFLLWLLVYDYLPTLILSTLVALAVSFVVSATWLSVFAVSGQTLLLSFIYTLLMASVIFCGAILFQAYRLSKIQPAVILKSE